MNKIIVELFFLLHVDMNKLKVIVINLIKNNEH